MKRINVKVSQKKLMQLKEHIVDIGDTQLGGQYIFNGFKTNIKPSNTVNR